jgi:hypothetical protein
MHEVVNGERGTAKGQKIVEPTMVLAGKTGTSQVRNITKAERERGVVSNEDLPWNRRDHALFVGFAPFDARAMPFRWWWNMAAAARRCRTHRPRRDPVCDVGRPAAA